MSDETAVAPIMLFDSEDEPQTCWVETTVTADEARDQLKGFLCDEDCKLGFRPVGDAMKEWLSPEDEHEERWEKCQPTDDGAREFWKIGVY
jgi:hypothetical protein